MMPSISARFVAGCTCHIKANAKRTVYLRSSLSCPKTTLPPKLSLYKSPKLSPVAFTTTVLSSLLFSSVSCERKRGSDGSDDFIEKLKEVVGVDKDGFEGLKKRIDKLATETGGKVEEIIGTGIPGQLSYGFVSGFASGYALKKVGRVGAIAFGFGFCTLQSLSYAGYIHVDYEKVGKDLKQIFDLNSDGKVDQADGKELYDRLIEILTYNIPAGSGFGAGFIAGVRSG